MNWKVKYSKSDPHNLVVGDRVKFEFENHGTCYYCIVKGINSDGVFFYFYNDPDFKDLYTECSYTYEELIKDKVKLSSI